jgi:hypothetical protein
MAPWPCDAIQLADQLNDCQDWGYVIECQDKEIIKLRKALESIAEGCSFPDDGVQRAIRDRARAALGSG